MTKFGGGNIGHIRSLAVRGGDHKLGWYLRLARIAAMPQGTAL
jgi:hypothetical protein